MNDELLRYDRMVEDALRMVVREALRITAEHGLGGDHHFYLTFRTDLPGVQISEALRQRYPREMTIVLQHRFWDLTVGDERFSVTLTFNEVPETLDVPFSAVAAFADPSVRFGLQFASTAAEEEEAGEQAEPVQPAEQAEEPEQPDEGSGENVVALDRFRNKP